MLVEKECAYCGKVFMPSHYGWAYKEAYRGCVKWFCTYTCMLKHRDKHKKKERADNEQREAD